MCQTACFRSNTSRVIKNNVTRQKFYHNWVCSRLNRSKDILGEKERAICQMIIQCSYIGGMIYKEWNGWNLRFGDATEINILNFNYFDVIICQDKINAACNFLTRFTDSLIWFSVFYFGKNMDRRMTYNL